MLELTRQTIRIELERTRDQEVWLERQKRPLTVESD